MNTVYTSAAESFTRLRRWRRGRLLGAAGATLVVLAVLLVALFTRLHATPADLDRSTTRRSEQGHYQISYTPHDGPITINTLHSWTLRVTTPDGEPITDARITVDGGMPQHGHGLPTQPRVTGQLGDGTYLIEGLKFQMAGWWVVDITIEAGGTRDSVRFNLLLS
jgi:hypothetical protein